MKHRRCMLCGHRPQGSTMYCSMHLREKYPPVTVISFRHSKMYAPAVRFAESLTLVRVSTVIAISVTIFAVVALVVGLRM